MYGVDLHAPPLISFDSAVDIPNISVSNRERYLVSLGELDPLSSVYDDDDFGISCYLKVLQIIGDII